MVVAPWAAVLIRCHHNSEELKNLTTTSTNLAIFLEGLQVNHASQLTYAMILAGKISLLKWRFSLKASC